jgi:multimeric flavodoxin WrbA
MAHILAVLMSGRRKGYTGGLWQAAVEAAQQVDGVEVEAVYAHEHQIGPCTSCFACIRRPEGHCVLDDDMGRRGQGEIFKKVRRANGLLIAEPVHMWGSCAQTHLFMERLYPLLWTGELSGMPVMTISCASNQGMQHLATRNLARWCFCANLHYIGGLSVHTAYLQEAENRSRYLGVRLAHAALEDAEGRQPLSDQEKWLAYMDKPWNALLPYLENLTRGTLQPEDSLIEYGLAQGTFRREEARRCLAQAREPLRQAIAAWRLKDHQAAQRHLLRASALWTRATWLEFLEEDVVGASQPSVYRPVPADD